MYFLIFFLFFFFGWIHHVNFTVCCCILSSLGCERKFFFYSCSKVSPANIRIYMIPRNAIWVLVTRCHSYFIFLMGTSILANSVFILLHWSVLLMPECPLLCIAKIALCYRFFHSWRSKGSE